MTDAHLNTRNRVDPENEDAVDSRPESNPDPVLADAHDAALGGGEDQTPREQVSGLTHAGPCYDCFADARCAKACQRTVMARKARWSRASSAEAAISWHA